MTSTENRPARNSILFVESQSEWHERLSSLPLDSVEVSFLRDFDQALQVVSDPKRSYHVLVTNIDFGETGGDKKGFDLARKVNELCLFTQVVFLDRRDPGIRHNYAKIIFGELRGYDYIEKDMFDPILFMEVLKGAIEKAAAEQRVVLLSPESGKDDFFDEILKPAAQTVGIQSEMAGQNLTNRPDERMDRVRLHIQSARIVVSDLRSMEVNVYYETGIADALPKDLLLVASRSQIHEKMISLQRIDVPADDTWKTAVRLELEKRIRSIIDGNSGAESRPAMVEDPVLCLALVPGDDDSQDTYQHLVLPVIAGLKLQPLQVNNQGYQLPLARIRNSIQKAHLVLFDISTRDEFLCYCAGYAVGLGKKVIFITQNPRDVPVDFVEQGPVIYSKRIQYERDRAKEAFGLAIRDKMLTHKPDDKGEAMKNVKVFINHASEDDSLVQDLYNELKKVSWIEPWLDRVNLLPGQTWQHEIQRAMESSDSVLVCMSTRSVGKIGVVQAEIRKAEELQNLRPPGRIFMIPILLENCDVPLELRKYQWVDISVPGNIDRIIRSLETLRY